MEFQLKGACVFRFYRYRLAFGRLPEYLEITADMRFVAGATAEEVYAHRVEVPDCFTQRAEFTQAYGAASNAQYVVALLGRHNLQQVTVPDPAQPDTGGKFTLTQAELVSRLDPGALTHAQVLRPA